MIEECGMYKGAWRAELKASNDRPTRTTREAEKKKKKTG